MRKFKKCLITGVSGYKVQIQHTKELQMTTMITPKGRAQYPWLNNADTKWHELGEYKVSLVLEGDEAADLMKTINDMIEEKVSIEQKGKKNPKLAPAPWSYEEDENGEETGRVIFKFKNRNRMNKNGELWDRKPLIVDSKGNPTNVEIGGGSVLRIKTELYPWHNAALGTGVSLQIKAVQVIDLEPLKKAEFDEIDGFEADENEEPLQRSGQDEDLF